MYPGLVTEPQADQSETVRLVDESVNHLHLMEIIRIHVVSLYQAEMMNDK